MRAMSDMNYEFLWNELKLYIREHLRVLTKIKELHTFYDIPVIPEDDGAIEMAEKTIEFIEDAERNRESRGMNYEKLWSLLWNVILAECVSNLITSMQKANDNEVRQHAVGAKDAQTAILDQMKTIEKEMTTAGQDDGQKVQD